MSTVDVGDAIELTFEITTGSTVLVTWINPTGDTVFADQDVAEDPAGSGRFPYTFLPNSAGVWTALFTASGAATAVERHYVRALTATSLPPLATVGDVAEMYGTLGAAQSALTSTLLRHASRMIRAAFTDVDDRIADGDLDAADVALAVTQMVLRVLRNPGGLRSESIGPFSRSWDTSAATGLLAITDAETALLAGAAAEGATGVAGTIWVRPGLAPPPLGTLGITRVRGW